MRSRRSALSRAVPVILLLGVCGCTVGPNYTPPKPPAIAAWNDRSAHAAPAGATGSVTQQSDPDPRWWERFNDPLLTRLMREAISGNLDLQQAVLRVVESRQGEYTARAAGLPSVNGTGSYMREQLGLRGLLESQGVYGGINSLESPNSSLNQYSPGLGNRVGSALGGTLDQLTQPVNLFQYGLDASWELDLFGRVRRSVEQAHAQTEAQVEATNDSLLMLESEVAQAYAQLRAAQALAADQQDNVQTARDALTLTQRRERQGLATQLDVEQALTQIASYEQQMPGYEKQTQQAMNRLSVLVGQPPGTLDPELAAAAPIPPVPPLVGIGVPSTLARRRPDIRAAEARLHAATANVGVAVASFYPDISLTGNFGMRATDASYLTNWASHFYSVGPSVSLPIFQGGRLVASLRLARAQEAEATLAYRGTVLNALREVEDALVAYRTDQAARAKLVETVNAGATTLYLARDRYTHGLSDFLQVLDAERTLVSARQQLEQTDLGLTNDVVALYRALGGGWEDTNAPAATVAAAPPITPAALDSIAAGGTH